VVPLLWVIRVAFRPVNSYIGDPSGLGGGFTLANFRGAWSSGGLGAGFINSLLVVPAGALGATILGAIGGFALAKFDPPFKRVLLAITITGVAVPLPAIIIPLFDEGLSLGFTDSRLGLVLIYIAAFSSWGTFFLYSYCQSIPDALIESARIDGAGLLQTFWRIGVPLAVPALVTVFVINLFIQWSELILALVMLPDSSKQTLTVHVAAFSTQYRTGGPLTAAGVILASLPVFVVFLFAQRYFRAGLTSGAVKQ
jgi:ABC-type glycerol-3-phosphate transport system permease component